MLDTTNHDVDCHVGGRSPMENQGISLARDCTRKFCDGSTASGSDENPPAARRGPVQPDGPPPDWRPAPWKRFRRGG